MKAIRNSVLSIVALVVLLFQLMNPVLAHADGETPSSPADTTVETTIPSTTPPLTEVVPTETPVPATSISPTADLAEANTPVPTQQGTSEPPPESQVDSATPVPTEMTSLTSTPVLTDTDPAVTEQPTFLETTEEIISNDTNVVVLDANGQALPLASQEAAQAITNSDPVWCPAGQAPTPGANGCTIGYATLADLVANEGGNIAADGNIWITSGPVADTNLITIDGLTYTTWSNFALTLQGGWSGIAGNTNVGANSVFSAPIEIINWGNSIVVNNVSIENLVDSDSPWTRMETDKGNITIKNSNFKNNSYSYSGSLGSLLSAPENIAINNSNIDGNEGGTFITSASLTIDNSNFNNSFNSMDVVRYAMVCSTNMVHNLNISNSNFNGNSSDGFTSDLCPGQDPNYNVTINNSNFNNNFSLGLFLNTGNSNFTIINSHFNNNGDGAQLNGHGSISGSSFSNNKAAGASLIGDWTLTNVMIDHNHFGLFFFGGGTMTLNDVTIDHNDIGLNTLCEPVNLVLTKVRFHSNVIDIGAEIPFYVSTCGFVTPNVTYIYSTLASQGEGEFTLDCTSVEGYSVNLPNGDQVQIFCPVRGRARISRLDNTALPAALPIGYTYASAFSLDILQNKIPIPVITEGGYIKASFVAPVLQEGKTYSVLYWDNGTWMPLKDFLLDANGNVHIFDLNPGVAKDIRKILSGVRVVATSGSPRVEVSTNFPGIFVLAQH